MVSFCRRAALYSKQKSRTVELPGTSCSCTVNYFFAFAATAAAFCAFSLSLALLFCFLSLSLAFGDLSPMDSLQWIAFAIALG